MDIYVLDELLRRIAIIDIYISLIWTERYAAYGDFELLVHDTKEIRNLVPKGTRLIHLQTSRIMVVETIEGNEDNEGNDVLTISGRSFEIFLEDRAAMPALAPLETTPNWVITGLPAQIVRTMFQTVCVSGVLSPRDILPFYTPGILSPAGNIPEPIDTFTFTIEPDSLYNSIKKICDIYGLGFRIVRGGDLSRLYFEVYTGDDRTSGQTVKPAVIFSKELDNLSNIKELSSTSMFKNVAYVFGQFGSAIVYASGYDATVSGSERRVLLVKAGDITLPAGDELTAALEQKGREELSNNRIVIAFDGEIPQSGAYVYGRDYNLGDRVEFQASDGTVNKMMVTEQIFISDKEGIRSYPTLELDMLITPNTWLSWNANGKWAELTTDEWADV